VGEYIRKSYDLEPVGIELFGREAANAPRQTRDPKVRDGAVAPWCSFRRPRL